MARTQSSVRNGRPATVWTAIVVMAGIALLGTPHTVKTLLDPALRAQATALWFVLGAGVLVLTWLTAFAMFVRWRWARWAGMFYFIILVIYGVRMIFRPFRTEVGAKQTIDFGWTVAGFGFAALAAAVAWGLATRKSTAAYFSGVYQPDVLPTLVSGRDPLALAAAILGGLAFVFGPLTGIPAVVCGHIAKRRIRRSPEASGRKLAIAGLVTGYVFSFFSLLTLALLFLSPASAQS